MTAGRDGFLHSFVSAALRDWPRADCGKIPLVAGAAGGPEKLFIHDAATGAFSLFSGGRGKTLPFIEAFLADSGIFSACRRRLFRGGGHQMTGRRPVYDYFAPETAMRGFVFSSMIFSSFSERTRGHCGTARGLGNSL